MIRTAIIAELKRQKLSNYELAKRSGISRQTIGRYVRGVRSVTDETASRLMAGLGLVVRGAK